MRRIEQKYKALRAYVIQHNIRAFVIGFRGEGWLAKTIQFFDDSYINHVGIGYLVGHGTNARVMIIDSNEDGLQPHYMSDRIKKYEDMMLFFAQYPEEDLSRALAGVIDRGEQGVKYDFLLLPKIAWEKMRDKIRRWCGKAPRNRVIDNSAARDICSEACRYFWQLLGIDVSRILTPEDFARYRPITVQIRFCDMPYYYYKGERIEERNK